MCSNTGYRSANPKARFKILFQMDQEFIHEALGIDGAFLSSIKGWDIDRELVLLAIRNGGCLRDAPGYERDDEIFEEAIKHIGNEYLMTQILPDHPRYHYL
jgi:hypothetical protein